MPIQIYRPTPKEDPMDKLSKALSVAGTVLNIKNSVQESGREADKVKAAEALNSGDSPESKAIAEDYKGLGFEVKPGDSAAALKRRYGETSDIYQARMKTEQKQPEGISQQYLAGFIKDGGRLVPPGTKGATTFLAVDNLGKPTQVGLIPPPLKKGESDVSGMTVEQRLNKQPVELRSKLGIVANALTEMTNYEKAFEGGQRPTRLNSDTPVVGTFFSDTDLTAAARNMNEAVGRLQSGGVIGNEELKTFRNMGARPGDSDDMKIKKMGKQRAFLQDRLVTFGFSPEDLTKIGNGNFNEERLGLDDTSVNRRQDMLSGSSPSTKTNEYEAKAGQFENKFTKEDVDALKWVKSNPKDPRANSIMLRLRAKGLK